MKSHIAALDKKADPKLGEAMAKYLRRKLGFGNLNNSDTDMPGVVFYDKEQGVIVINAGYSLGPTFEEVETFFKESKLPRSACIKTTYKRWPGGGLGTPFEVDRWHIKPEQSADALIKYETDDILKSKGLKAIGKLSYYLYGDEVKSAARKVTGNAKYLEPGPSKN